MWTFLGSRCTLLTVSEGGSVPCRQIWSRSRPNKNPIDSASISSSSTSGGDLRRRRPWNETSLLKARRLERFGGVAVASAKQQTSSQQTLNHVTAHLKAAVLFKTLFAQQGSSLCEAHSRRHVLMLTVLSSWRRAISNVTLLFYVLHIVPWSWLSLRPV